MTNYAVNDWASDVVGSLAEATAAYETKIETIDNTKTIRASGILYLPRRGYQAYIIYDA